jgi:single-strand DNA-binding protein
MASLNKVFLIGGLTRDPQLRYTPSGTAVADLGLAVTRFRRGQEGQAAQEETCYLDITVWGKQAENATEYLSKGRQVFIEGYLRLDTWDDKKTGEKRSRMRIVAERVQYLGSPAGGRPAGNAGQKGAAGKPGPEPGEEPQEAPDDDIPF